ncbi:MAG: hypothetical protein HY360_18335 [Verrucomicrobia bacterium]|nr:hypothetical protein [Verrucomicrobiota bacterium]
MSKAPEKIQRLRAALSHHEGDRVPVGEFFWTGFLKRARARWGADFDPYRHFDLDYIVITPNMDPRIQSFQILKQEGEEILLKTGFGATIRCGLKGDLHPNAYGSQMIAELYIEQLEPIVAGLLESRAGV